MGRLGTTSSGGRMKAAGVDLSTVEGLYRYAEQKGLGQQAEAIAEPLPKLSFLQRLGKGLGAFNPAEAILTGVEEKNVGKGVVEYGKNVLQGVGSAITGHDYEPDRRSFFDVADALGVHNAIARFGIGLAGDILLDPSTYFGGALAKGLVKTIAKGTDIAAVGIGRLAPETEAGLRMATQGVKDAFGRAFRFGYKASEDAVGDVLTFLSKKDKAALGLAASNLDRLGVGVLTDEQRLELATKLIAGKRSEFELGQQFAKDQIQKINELFPELNVKTAEDAAKVIKTLESTTQVQVEGIRSKIDELVRPYFADREAAIKAGNAIPNITSATTKVQAEPFRRGFANIDEMNGVVKGLREELTNLRKAKGVVPAIGDAAKPGFEIAVNEKTVVELGNKLIKTEEQRLSETINSLQDLIDKAKKAPAGAAKAAGQALEQGTPIETMMLGEKMIVKLQNDLADKSRLLGSVLTSRVTAKQIVKDAIATGDFSKLTPEAAKLAEKLVPTSADPLVQKAIEAQMKRTAKFAEQLDLENPYDSYFPFIKKDKVEAFLGQVTGKKLRVGSEDYIKEFKNLMTDDKLERDPAKAFFNSEAAQVADRMTRGFLEGFVKKYGKTLDSFINVDDAKKAGFDIIKEKGFFGKDLGYVSKFDANLIKDSLSPEFQTVSMLAKATGFDAVTQLFKRSVTGLFLPFHVRNYVSGIIQNYERVGVNALNPKFLAAGQKWAYLMGKGEEPAAGILNVAGKEMKISTVFKSFTERFGNDTFYQNDFLSAVNQGTSLEDAASAFSKAGLKETVKTLGLGQNAIPFKLARTAGQFIEHQQKAVAYLAALADGNSIKKALLIAEEAGFDYRAVTRFESQIMRRIVPFYSFTRKNIELQLKTLGENPQRINHVLAFFQNLGEPISGDEKKSLPAYLAESIGIKIGDTPEGLKQYIASFGTPIEAFTQLFGSNPVLRGISQMNPILKAPIEIGTGRDSFRQKDLKDVYDAREYKMAPQFIKDLLDIKEVQKDVMGKTPTGKLVKTGERTQYVADPVKLLIARSLFTSRGVSYLDQLFGGDIHGFAKLLKTTTGLKPQQVDIEQQAGIKESQKKRELEDLLTKYGETRQFRKTYVPK